MTHSKNVFILLLTAIIWGFAFVAQSTGMDYVGPFTFTCVRSLIGGIFLIPCIMLLDRLKSNQERRLQEKQDRKTLLLGGITCGILFCFATNTQQIGIMYTSVGKAGFITACYIIIVPILGIFLKKSCSILVWISIFIALIGLYLLCINESFSVNKGDVYIMICALLFSFHILTIDHFSPMVDGVRMSCIQFFTCGILSAIPMLLFEGIPNFSTLSTAAIPILYAGVLSCGVAYTLQIIGQKNFSPTIASLILSLESTFSVIGGWLILHETLNMRERIGCICMFVAIMLSQIPMPKQTK